MSEPLNIVSIILIFLSAFVFVISLIASSKKYDLLHNKSTIIFKISRIIFWLPFLLSILFVAYTIITYTPSPQGFFDFGRYAGVIILIALFFGGDGIVPLWPMYTISLIGLIYVSVKLHKVEKKNKIKEK